MNATAPVRRRTLAPDSRNVAARTHLAMLGASGRVAKAVGLQPRGMRLFGRSARTFARVFPRSSNAFVSVHDRSLFRVDLWDHYWARLLVPGVDYEPPVRRMLSRLLDADAAFVDGGANLGYWSLFAAERLDDPRRVIAVEASGATYSRLRANLALNAYDVIAERAALGSRVGDVLELVTARGHASAHLRRGDDDHLDESAYRTERVTTVTIDDLVDRHLDGHRGAIVLKLDVEGAECDTLAGAADTLRSGRCAIVYEDHGRDRTCAPSRMLLDELGYRIYESTTSGFVPITSVADVLVRKIDHRRGYDFVAVAPDSDIERRLRS